MKPILLRVAIALLTFMFGISAALVANFGFDKKDTNTACKGGFHRAGCAHRQTAPPTSYGCSSSRRY